MSGCQDGLQTRDKFSLPQTEFVVVSWQCGEREGSQMTFAEFWPDYVRAHSKPATRVVHCVGTILGWMLVGGAIAVHRWWWIAAAVVVAYALAWLSHFLVEHNRPATFEHPLWSWWADQRMVFLTLIGRMGEEAKKFTAGRQV
jgi:hypothetical protein